MNYLYIYAERPLKELLDAVEALQTAGHDTDSARASGKKLGRPVGYRKIK